MASTETLEGKTLDIFTPAEVKDMLEKKEIVLIDVRTPNEFAIEHVDGALLYPLSHFNPEFLPEQGEKRLVFHCGSGMRSHKAAACCAAAGLEKIAHMQGGFGAWKEAGLPYLATDPATGNIVAKP